MADGQKLLATLKASALVSAVQMAALEKWFKETVPSPSVDDVEARATSTRADKDLVLTEWQWREMREGRSDFNAGPYLKLRELAEAGGQGRLYEAFDLDAAADARVALKVWKCDPANSWRLLEREAEVLKSIDHPSVVKLAGWGNLDDDDKTPYLATELLPGVSIQRRVDAGGPLPLDQALAIGVRLLQALSYLHKLPEPVLHRDIHPKNVMLVDLEVPGAPPRPVLIDFGLCKRLGAPSGLGLSDNNEAIVGRLAYLRRGDTRRKLREADPSRDVYGAAATMYFMLTGRPPYAETTPHALVAAIDRGWVPPLRQVVPNASEALERVLAKALAPEIADGFQAADELLAALRNAGVAVPEALKAHPELRAQAAAEARVEAHAEPQQANELDDWWKFHFQRTAPRQAWSAGRAAALVRLLAVQDAAREGAEFHADLRRWAEGPLPPLTPDAWYDKIIRSHAAVAAVLGAAHWKEIDWIELGEAVSSCWQESKGFADRAAELLNRHRPDRGREASSPELVQQLCLLARNAEERWQELLAQLETLRRNAVDALDDPPPSL